MRKGKCNANRGFSLVETVVAIAVISIISFSALTTILFVEKKLAETDAAYFFAQEISSLLDCYRSNGREGFVGLAQDYYSGKGIEYSLPQLDAQSSTYTFYYDSDFSVTTDENAQFRVIVEIDTGRGFLAKAMSRRTTVYEMKSPYKTHQDYARLSNEIWNVSKRIGGVLS